MISSSASYSITFDFEKFLSFWKVLNGNFKAYIQAYRYTHSIGLNKSLKESTLFQHFIWYGTARHGKGWVEMFYDASHFKWKADSVKNKMDLHQSYGIKKTMWTKSEWARRNKNEEIR